MRFLFLCWFVGLTGIWQPAKAIEIGPCQAETSADVERIDVRAWPGPGPREARFAMWKAFVAGARRICFADPGGSATPSMRAIMESAGVITRNQALFAPLARRKMRGATVNVDPAGTVAVHILESADAIVIVGLNDSSTTRRVKITFPLDIPEAIWQDMEAGNAVNFVMEKQGPSYRHTFAPYDAVVLAIRKKLR